MTFQFDIRFENISYVKFLKPSWHTDKDVLHQTATLKRKPKQKYENTSKNRIKGTGIDKFKIKIQTHTPRGKNVQRKTSQKYCNTHDEEIDDYNYSFLSSQYNEYNREGDRINSKTFI